MKSEQPLKCGLIGCGFFSEYHLNGWREVTGADVVAVCDLELEKADNAADKFDIDAAYGDARLMLDAEDLDFVDIVTVMDSHRSLVELAASKGVPAIVQKPFAPTMEDARAMVDVCHEAGVPLMVHENFRWQTPLLSVRRVIDRGAIGEPFFGRVSFRHGNPVGYESQPYLFEQAQYIINDVGIHLLDLARFYFGEATRVYTEAQRVNERFKGEDVATLLLRHENGATSIVDLSVSTKVSPDPFAQTMVSIEGREGTVELGYDYVLKVTSNGTLETLNATPKPYPWAQPPWEMVQESVVNIQQHWVDSLLAGATPATSGEDNLKSLALVFAAYESAERQVPVSITTG